VRAADHSRDFEHDRCYGHDLAPEVTLLSGVCKGVGSGLVIAVGICGSGTRMSLCMTYDPRRVSGLPSTART